MASHQRSTRGFLGSSRSGLAVLLPGSDCQTVRHLRKNPGLGLRQATNFGKSDKALIGDQFGRPLVREVQGDFTINMKNWRNTNHPDSGPWFFQPMTVKLGFKPKAKVAVFRIQLHIRNVKCTSGRFIHLTALDIVDE